MDLTKLLKPKKVAIVGASEKENLGGFTVRMMMEHGKNRLKDMYLVNPNQDEIFGMKVYKSLSDIPENIDLVVIATPKRTVLDILKEAKTKGAGGAVVYASGYGETGKEEDRVDEDELIELCRELDIALMGPNCAGYMNFVDNIFPMGFLATGRDKVGKVGLISQSGMICTLLLDSHKNDFSYIISNGNSKVVDTVDYMDFLVDDEDTQVISVYIEGITDAEKFIKVLKKAALKKKPIVMLKAGRSEAGARAAASHTGSLSGSDKVFDAIFHKFGVIRVDDLEDLASVSNMLATLKELPKSNRIAAVNGAGGETTISADVGSLYELNYPEFSKETIEALEKVLPDYATINNPLDTTATPAYDTDIFAELIETVAKDPNIDLIMVGITMVPEITDLCVTHMSEGIAKFVREGEIRKPIIVVPMMEAGRKKEVIDLLKDVGVPVMPSSYHGYKHVKLLMDYIKWLSNMDIRTLETAIPKNDESGAYALSEHESKKLLGEFGIPIPREDIARSEKEAVELAAEIGFPIVMKIESADILHKSDIGGVKLNIESFDDVRKYYNEILKNAETFMKDANINGVLIQKMLPKGTEVIIGVNTDPLFGPVVLFGLGGIFVELFEDVKLYPAPFGKEEAYEMINSLKSSKMFTGYRGEKELDIEALADTLVAVSDFAVKYKDNLLEADINPLFVYEKGQGVAAADGLVILRNSLKGDESYV